MSIYLCLRVILISYKYICMFYIFPFYFYFSNLAVFLLKKLYFVYLGLSLSLAIIYLRAAPLKQNETD